MIALLVAGILGVLAGRDGDPAETALRAGAARAPLAERLRERGFAPGSAVHLRIYKAEHRMEVWLRRGDRYALFDTYPICRWSGRLGPKLREGDGQAPEGFYAVRRTALNPNSAYHLSFNLGFPNAHDRALGRTGSFLMVHGACVSVGCYAMTDRGIEDLWALMTAAYDAGQREVAVDALPFRMTPEMLDRRAGDSNLGFWRELAAVDARFAETGRPPAVWSCAGRYSVRGGPGCAPVRSGG